MAKRPSRNDAGKSEKSHDRKRAENERYDSADSPPPKAAGGRFGLNGIADAPWVAYGLRLWIVAMFGWTIWVTRPLWTAHAVPPLLPLVELPSAIARFDYYGMALFAAVAASVAWPRVGWSAYVAIAAVSLVADQTRMQPQLFSFALLMLGTWRQPAARLLARSHLASLWFFSGLHKLLSPGYYEQVAPWLWEGIAPVADWPNLADYSGLFGSTIAAIEMGMGLAVWVPRLRKYVAALALMMHFGIVALLQHMNGWNTSVWGWNCAIAIVAFVLIGGWREPLRNDCRQCGMKGVVPAVILFLSPVLFYFGKLDAYLSHCLYSANVPTAIFYPADGESPYQMNGIEGPYWDALNVPQPPAHRVFEAYFRHVAKPGDTLSVADGRVWAKLSLNSSYHWRCDRNGVLRRELAPPDGKQRE
ncbi:MAG: hypothetical protein K8U03_14470 [Planctomycetia bacterium]|nr:hypothetical protein [Planctomycetia bacterium]